MRYQCVKQYDSTDCACACLASIARHYGSNISLANVIGLSTINKDGMNLLEVENLADKIGFDAYTMKKTVNFDETQIKIPCIAHVILEDGMHHYIVIYKVKKNKIIIADPSLGVLSIERSDFFYSTCTKKSQYIWSGILIFLNPNESFSKKSFYKYRKSTYQNIIQSQKNIIMKIILISMVAMLLKVASSFYFQILLDIIIPYHLAYTSVFITAIFVATVLVHINLDRNSVKICLQVSKNISQKLSMNYYSHVLKLPNSDIIYVLEVGKISAYGRHEELIQKSDLYCRYLENIV